MLGENLRKTSVIWSVEASLLETAMLSSLTDGQADALRVVMERGESKRVLEFVAELKAATGNWPDPVPVLVDLYPHPRGVITGLDEAQDLEFGREITFSPVDGKGDFKIETEEWSTLFAVDHSVYIGFGMSVLKPSKISDSLVTMQVVQGGRIYPGAYVHVPFTHKPVAAEQLSQEVWDIVKSGDIDYAIIPSLDDPVELEKIKDKIEAINETPPWLLLKVGTRSCYENLEALLPFVRGVLVSRIELAMDMDPARVPMVTKEIIQMCNNQAKMVLVASEMLGSMRHNATPTRAEVSDIANAVFDGADAIILSEMLAEGKYLTRGSMLARKTVEDVEQGTDDDDSNWMRRKPHITHEIEAITYASYKAAARNGAKAVVCITKQGNTDLHLKSFGIDTPIIAITTSPEVVRKLRLVRGVEGLLINELPSIDEVLPLINGLLVEFEWLDVGDKYVFVSVSLSSLSTEESNLYTVQTITS